MAQIDTFLRTLYDTYAFVHYRVARRNRDGVPSVQVTFSGSTTEKFLFDSRQGQAMFLKSIQIGTVIPIQGTSKFIFPGVKRPRREANQSSTAEVKNQ